MESFEIACVIIYKDDKVLCRRISGGQFDGLWEFPYAKREKGQEGLLVLKNAIQKIGLQTKDEMRRLDNNYQCNLDGYGEINVDTCFYTCRYLSGEIDASIFKDYKWCSSNELLSLNFVEVYKSTIANLRKELTKRKFYLCVVKEGYKVYWDDNFKDVKDNLEIVWQGMCSFLKIQDMFSDEVGRMVKNILKMNRPQNGKAFVSSMRKAN
jgi:hypothetical protein